MKREIITKQRIRVYLAEYNTDDTKNPKERASLYEHCYVLKGGGRSETIEHEIIIRHKSKMVFRSKLTDFFGAALIDFQEIVRERAQAINPVAKMTLEQFYGGRIPLSEIEEAEEQ